MEQSFNLPDSTDWLDTPLSLLTPLESSLRCQVCKDFFENPVITSCSHTFCSLCIRRCLTTEGKCPACRSGDQELKLRRNWAVQELVDTFQNARPGMLQLAKRAAAIDRGEEDQGADQPSSKKRKVGGQETQTDAAERRQTRSRSKGIDRQSEPAMMEVIEDSADEEYVPEDGLVACPVCRRRMKNEAVFPHLDVCPGDSAPPKQVSFGSLQPMSPVSRKESTNKAPERLPVINYSLLKDNILRKKLKDLGIPNSGARSLLQRRHTEWMNLWNANCDSKAPKSKRELLHELDIWERTQGGNVASSIESAGTVMRKDFDAAAWSTNHDNDFKRLIANARKKNDAAIRSTIPQVSTTSEEQERVSGSEQAMDSAAPTGNIQRPEEVQVDLPAAEVAEKDVQTTQDPSTSQPVCAPPG